MSKKREKRTNPALNPSAPFAPFLGLTAALPLLVTAVVAVLSSRSPWYADEAARLYPTVFRALAFLAFACAVVVVVKRELVSPEPPPLLIRLWLAAAFLGLASFLVLHKYFQYHGCHLPSDTAAMANIAFNFNARGSLESSVLGASSYFAVHFMPLIGLFAPLARLTNGPFPLLAAQSIVVAATPAAVYALVYQRSRSLPLAAAGLWLCFANPLFLTTARASLAPQVCLPAFLLWGAYCVETKRWVPAALLFTLAASCTEQAPLTFFGVGLYLACRHRPWGIGVCVAACLLWWGEMHYIASFPDHIYWERTWFAQFGSSAGEVVRNTLPHPLDTLQKVAWPPGKLGPLWRAMWTTGFFGVLAPLEALVFLVAFVPHLAAPPGVFYHDLAAHYPAYMLGPLLWAMSVGLCRLHGALSARGRGAWAVAAALAFTGLDFASAAPMLDLSFGPQFFWSMPVLAPRVPAGASVWVSEWGAPWVAYRRYVKCITDQARPESERGLFRPDYVLVDPTFLYNERNPIGRDRVLTFMAHERYGLEGRTETMFLFKHPAAGGTIDPPPAVLPEADFLGRAYGDALRRLVPMRPG